MRIIKSCKCLFVFVLLTFLFSGCTGSSSPSSLNNNVKTNSNIVPNNGADTFDFANAIKGSWVWINGSGTATGYGGTFNLAMSRFDYVVSDSRTNGDTGNMILTGYEDWNIYNQSGKYITTVSFQNNYDNFEIVHIGANTWRYEFPEQLTVTIRMLSETTAQVIQEGVRNYRGFNYNYTFTMNLQKRTYGYETRTEPNTDTVNNEVETETETNNLTDTFDIQEILNGKWIGISGTGTAMGYNSTYNVSMLKAQNEFSNTTIWDTTGYTYFTCSQDWDVYNGNGEQITTVGLRSDNDYLKMIRTGQNTWRCEHYRGAVLIIKVTSETTIDVVEEGSVNIEGYDFNHFLHFTAQKIVEDENEVTIPTENTNPETVFEQQQQQDDVVTNNEKIVGIWSGESGSGRAKNQDNVLELRFVSTNMSFSEVDDSASDGSNMYVATSSIWDVYQDNNYVRTISINNDKEAVSVYSSQTTDYWGFSFPSSGNGMTISLSEDTASVTENGTLFLGEAEYIYTLSYKAVKQ